MLVAGEAPTAAECAAKSLPLRRTSCGLPSSKSATGGRSGSVHSGAGLRRAPAIALCMLRQGARQAPLPPQKKERCCLANEVSEKNFIKVLCRCNPFFRSTACSAHLLPPRSGLSTPASFIVLSAKRSARPSGMQAQACAPVVTHTVPRTTTVPSPLKGLVASRASRISIPSPAAERFQGCQESL